MMTFLSYLLDVNTIFSVYYILYVLLFSRLTHFKWNRFALIFGVLSSLIIPLIPKIPVIDSYSIVNLPEFAIGQSSEVSINEFSMDLLEILGLFYLLVCGILLLRFCLGLISFCSFILKRTVRLQKGIAEITPDPTQPSFSFFHYLHINPNDNIDAIRQHEMVHIKEWHTLDAIVMRLFQIVNWINPLTYLALRSLLNTHEYLADEKVVQKGFETSHYCELLVDRAEKKLIPAYFHAFSINTNLKPRIMMLSKRKSKKNARWLYALAIPVIVLATAFAPGIPNTDEGSMAESFTELAGDTAYQKVDDMPVFGSGMDDLIKYLGDAIKYPKKAEEENITGRVMIGFIVDENGKVRETEVVKGVRKDLDDEALRVIQNMPDWKAGKKDGKKVKVKMMLPIVYAL